MVLMVGCVAIIRRRH
ncbi:MAG: hypothetical protein GC164_10935 [Phycisphaera sp.]|nr:hypothetical protein [Phycisphaera sp.]